MALTSTVALASAAGCSSDGAASARPVADVGRPDEGPSQPLSPIDSAPRSEPAAAGAPAAVGVQPEALSVAPFHIIGRSDARDPAGPRLSWSGTEIRARFSGTGLKVELADTGVSHYDVSIDGAPPRPLAVFGERRAYHLATALEAGVHDVVLTKRTESFTGVTQLFGFIGTLVPSPPPSGRRMELIGDSITCGFGVLGPDETCAFSAATESEPSAWGALAAKELGALRMVTAVSGLGVLRNYDGATTETMPQRYDRALADDASSVWEHHAFEPDLIVVNLGTNDFAGGKGDPGPGFEAAYTKLLATLRETHPGAWIVATTSPMLSNENHARHRGYVAAAIAARAAAGDTKISLVDIDEQSPSDGYGCGYHPSVSTHAKMAARLVEHVKPRMGW